MKAAPVVESLRSKGLPPALVHTGQHYDEAMSDVFFRQLGMVAPDHNLGIGSGTHGRQTAALIVAIEDLLHDVRPSRVVVYGDINSTLAAALVASKLQIPLAHVESGLRSFDRSMPEEVNRVVTDALADIHFTTSPEAAAQLGSEGIAAEGIHFVGNPMIDSLLRFRDTLDVDGVRSRYGLPPKFAVATLHRPSNVDQPAHAARIVEGLRKVANELPILLPLHPRGRVMLESQGIAGVASLHVVDPLGYLEFMALLSSAALVLTDSGGIQEETTVLGVPCLTLRENTERPITIEMGTNRLVGSDPDEIQRGALEFLERPPRGRRPPLWDGKAGERIASILAATA